MAKDERQWMRFPIDMHRDPKITRLPVEVRWTFFEMNGEARLEKNDGVFTVEDAEFRWPVEHLAALCGSHPTAPLVVRSDDAYRLRSFAKHQFTEADREELRKKRSEAGAKGGKATALAKQMPASAKQVLSKSQQTAAESESDQDLEIDDYSYFDQSSQETYRARNLDLTDHRINSIANCILLQTGIEPSPSEILAFVEYVCTNASSAVRRPVAYAKRSIQGNPGEVRQWFDAFRRSTIALGPTAVTA